MTIEEAIIQLRAVVDATINEHCATAYPVGQADYAVDFIAEFISDNYVRAVNAQIKAKDFIAELKAACPAECAHLRRKDIISMVERAGVIYCFGSHNQRVFKGIGKKGTLPASMCDNKPIIPSTPAVPYALLQTKLNKVPPTTNQRVYVFELSDHRTKIGISNNIKQRIGAVEHGCGLEIVDFSATVPLANAAEIESRCHGHFFKQRGRGEFFHVNHAAARKYLSTLAQLEV